MAIDADDAIAKKGRNISATSLLPILVIGKLSRYIASAPDPAITRKITIIVNCDVANSRAKKS